MSTHPPLEVDTTSDGTTPLRDALVSTQDCSAVARQLWPTPEPEPEIRPDLVRAAPSSARPGQEVDLLFPEETGRGIPFFLEREVGDGWEQVALMTSDANGARYQQTVVLPDDEYGWIDVGVRGPGPDAVVLPDELTAGDYRVCTANAGANFCAPPGDRRLSDRGRPRGGPPRPTRGGRRRPPGRSVGSHVSVPRRPMTTAKGSHRTSRHLIGAG